MRTFPVVAAALVLAGGAVVTGATMTSEPEQAATVRKGRAEDRQGDEVRRLAVLAGRGSQLGVSVRDVDPAVQGKSGAIVEEVREGSAAEKAGIRKGDVIAEFDGERVRGVRHLTRLVSETPEGRSVTAVVERDGKRLDLTVTPESGAMAFGGRDFELVVPHMRFEHLPGVEQQLRRELERSLPREGTWSFRGRPGEAFSFRMNERGRLGVSIQPLEGQLAEYFGTEKGVLVNSVEKDSPAARAGLKAGDVVTAVNGRAVDEPSELIDAVRDAGDGATLSIDIVRDKKPQSLTAELEKREPPDAPRRRQLVRPI
jgi:membrane-associated protease RseP (regulator of RpoE activity)